MSWSATIWFFNILGNYAWNINIENRIYREELKESLGMNFFIPFQPEREFKVNHVNVHKLYAVEYINIVSSLFLKLLNKLYNELGE